MGKRVLAAAFVVAAEAITRRRAARHRAGTPTPDRAHADDRELARRRSLRPVAGASGVSPVGDLLDDPRGARSSRGGRSDLPEEYAERQAGGRSRRDDERHRRAVVGVDRTFRETALKTEEPSRTLRDVQSGMTAYRTQHAKLLEYVRTTTDDLRSRLVERQNCDAYQWALLISTHEQRHVLQIREIKAHPKYPKG